MVHGLSKLQHWRSQLVQLAYPDICLLCGAPGFDSLDLCAGCLGQLPRQYGRCQGCAAPLPEKQTQVCCTSCRMQPPAYDRAWAAFDYAAPIDWLLGRFKFNRHLHYGRLLGLLMQQSLQGVVDRPDVIIPVPLHSSRLRERGFNQTVVLAQPMAKAMSVPIDRHAIKRQQNTISQRRLSAQQRQQNLSGVFTIHRHWQADHVAVVDDVMATGTTINELALLLKNHGVRRVDVWLLARTDLHNGKHPLTLLRGQYPTR